MAVWNLSLPTGSKVQIDDNVFHITHKNRKQEKEGTHILKGEIFGSNGQQVKIAIASSVTDISASFKSANSVSKPMKKK